MRKIVITGCSGGGKSTLLGALADRGFATVKEPGRRVIAAERASQGQSFPWTDPIGFAERAYQMALEDHASATAPLTFFDRSALDQAAWFARAGLEPPTAPPLYDPMVLLAPPWEALFATDEDRRHGFDEALLEYNDLARKLPRWGYRCFDLPKAPVPDRVAFVLETIASEPAL